MNAGCCLGLGDFKETVPAPGDPTGGHALLPWKHFCTLCDAPGRRPRPAVLSAGEMRAFRKAGAEGPPQLDRGFQVRLEGSSSPCQGRLQVYTQDSWSSVCADSWGLAGSSPPDPRQASQLCQRLRCGDICRLGIIPAFNAPQPRLRELTCQGPPGSFSNCSSSRTRSLCQTLGLVCLGCGSFLKWLPEAEAPEPQWTVRNASCQALPQCFQRAPPGAASPALGLVCSGFQPKVQSRLVGGGSVCQGTVEVRQGGPGVAWAALCHSAVARSSARWDEVCQEQQCGRAAAVHVLDAGEGTGGLLWREEEQLSRCHALQEKRSLCHGVHVSCQDPKPPGPAAGTVGSIVLALLLSAVLLAVCVPLAYRKLLKKVRQKKQRQWIGPTGMSQTMSFHRNPTGTVRAQPENRPESHADNEYSQPPRNSRLSAYPALEGALRLSAAQPDNSSDSDYDLHTAQRL
ncbi:T-cell surface glycoprotein CD5 [Heterocephalus glaber]|uniref:T-cell surface glycoprotein CD5 n=1 Tax=Heterocephalus glaber TaxID=10181 RepID=G5AYE8_HETGA|nr:T-cell surface glycoprotein CD5 [Heterocephalus glaber]